MRTTILVFALVLSACVPDECAEQGEARCRDGVAESCISQADDDLRSHLGWVREACGDRACVPLPGKGAFCALEGAPDPSYPPELANHRTAARCVNGNAVEWRHGYRVRETACAPSTPCMDVGTPGFDPTCTAVAFCSSLPNETRCTEPGIATSCIDDSIIAYCSCGKISDAHACASPGPSCVPLGVAGAKVQAACR